MGKEREGKKENLFELMLPDDKDVKFGAVVIF